MQIPKELDEMLKVAFVYFVVGNKQGKFMLHCIQKKGAWEKLTVYPVPFETKEDALNALEVFLKRGQRK